MTPRRDRRLITTIGTLVLALVLLPLTTGTRATAQTPAGRRTGFASVLDSHGKAVSGLSGRDFVVEVDGVTLVESVNPVRSVLRSILTGVMRMTL